MEKLRPKKLIILLKLKNNDAIKGKECEAGHEMAGYSGNRGNLMHSAMKKELVWGERVLFGKNLRHLFSLPCKSSSDS
jgi:hypothetical protein